MRMTSKLLALALAASLQPAIAGTAPTTVDFENIAGSVNAFGLLDLTTTSVATGVSFSGAAWGVASNVNPAIYPGCSANNWGYAFGFTPNATGCNAMLLADSALGTLDGKQTAVIKVDGGFTASDTSGNASRLFFAAQFNAGATVTAYETLQNASSKYKTWNISNGCTASAAWCKWDELLLDIDFTAYYLVIEGNDQQLLLDDLTFVAPTAATTPPGRLPEPASLALALGALGVLGWSRKRASA